MSGTMYCRSELTAPWGLAFPAMANTLMFHVVMAGTCWLESADGESCRLVPGAFALVPDGQGHRLASAPGTPAIGLFDAVTERVSDRYEIITHGGGGTRTTLMCGAVRFDDPAAAALVAVLPAVVVVDTWRAPQLEWMQTTLRYMIAEASELRTGGETVITRLADVLVIEAVRAWLSKDPAARRGWLGGLRDPQIGRAIRALHARPGHGWTIASLASEAGMSRSAFSARFAALVGEPVMRYVTRWRMHVARATLRHERITIAALADRLGYNSEAAFARAFKRVTGEWPGEARERHR
jgi:AraC-like DNA-binding protein